MQGVYLPDYLRHQARHKLDEVRIAGRAQFLYIIQRQRVQHEDPQHRYETYLLRVPQYGRLGAEHAVRPREAADIVRRYLFGRQPVYEVKVYEGVFAPLLHAFHELRNVADVAEKEKYDVAP